MIARAMPSPQGWRAMFAYRGDGGDVVLRTSPLKSWTLVEGSRGRLQTNGVTEDGDATGVGNPHFCGYLRKGVCAEEYQKVAEAHLRRLEEAGAPLWPTKEDYEQGLRLKLEGGLPLVYSKPEAPQGMSEEADLLRGSGPFPALAHHMI